MFYYRLDFLTKLFKLEVIVVNNMLSISESCSHQCKAIEDSGGGCPVCSGFGRVVTQLSKDEAATIIQKNIRGYFARKPYLPSNLNPQYRAQCNRATGCDSVSMPQAQGGRTRVYLPQELPMVVLKDSGRKEAITRFHQMQEVRSILNSQKSSHLIIPKARLCQNFIVEQRLPINADSYHNMWLYLSQSQLFDDAVPSTPNYEFLR